MVRPQQKNVVLVKDFGRKIIQAWSAGAGHIFKTIPTAKACLFLYERWQFVGCDKDVDYLENSVESITVFYASQMLNDMSTLAADDQLDGSPCVYLAAAKCRRLVHRWSAG